MKVLVFDIDGTLIRTNSTDGKLLQAAISPVIPDARLESFQAYPEQTDSAILREMCRVGNRVLIIDHQPDPDGSLRSRVFRAVATGFERIAGGDHYRNYRAFLAAGGIPDLVARAGRGIAASDSAAAGTMGVYLVG